MCTSTVSAWPGRRDGLRGTLSVTQHLQCAVTSSHLLLRSRMAVAGSGPFSKDHRGSRGCWDLLRSPCCGPVTPGLRSSLPLVSSFGLASLCWQGLQMSSGGGQQ